MWARTRPGATGGGGGLSNALLPVNHSGRMCCVPPLICKYHGTAAEPPPDPGPAPGPLTGLRQTLPGLFHDDAV